MRTLFVCARRFSFTTSLLLGGAAFSAATAEPPHDAASASPEVAGAEAPLLPLSDQAARAWTDSGGERQVHATLVAANSESVELRKASGQSFVIPLSALSVKDQDLIRQQLAQRSQVTRHEVKKIEIPNIAPVPEFGKPPVDAAAPIPGNMVYVRISHELLARQVGRDVRYRTDIVDNILGTSIRGTGDVEGRTDLVIFDGADGVRGELRLSGKMNSRTTGYNGPVQIGSRAVTQFKSAKAIVLDEKGLRVGPSVTNAKTQSTTTGISSNLGGIGDRIARNRASGEVAAKRPTADRIAAEHASQRINRRFDAQVAERMDELKNLPADTLSVDKDHPLKPKSYRCKTAGNFVYIAVLGDCSGENSLVTPPVWNPVSAGLEIYVHAAAVERAMADQELQKSLKPLVDSVAGAMTSEVRTVGNNASAASQDWDTSWSEDRQWLRLSWHGEKLPTLARQPKPPATKIR